MPKKSETRFCIVLTSYSKPSVGARISRELLRSRLAACVQVVPVESSYTWKGRIVRSRERVMLIKARSSDFKAIERLVLGLHDYEVPELVQIGIERGLGTYLSWLAEVTR